MTKMTKVTLLLLLRINGRHESFQSGYLLPDIMLADSKCAVSLRMLTFQYELLTKLS